MAKILILDLGTTYVKATLFDQSGTIVALDRVAPPIVHPFSGRWELDAHAFQQTIKQAIARLHGQNATGLSDVDAICFSTQTNSFVLLDGHDQPLTPLILWPDERATELEDQLRSMASDADVANIAGHPVLSPKLLPAKLLWIQRHQPEVWRLCRRICLMSDFLTLWLTGQHVTEAGAMAFTALVDIRTCTWWQALCDRFELPGSFLPTIVRAGTDVGPLRAQIAEELGLPRHCRLIVGAFDQHVGAVGVGNVEPGDLSETTGTVLVSIRCTRELQSLSHVPIYQGPAFATGLFFQLAVSETSANLLEWYRNQLPDRPDFAELDRLAADVPADAGGLRLTSNPHPQSMAELFTNLGPQHTRGHAVRCILETVARELKQQVSQLWGDDQPAMIRAAGGASRSELWLQIKADVLGFPVAATECPEPTSLGAAMLAGQALGWGSLQELSRRWIRVRRVYEPAHGR